MVLTSVLVLSRSNPRRMVYTVAVAATVNIGLNFALIPGLGDVGSALAMLSSMVVYTSIALWLALLGVGRISWASMLAAPGVAAIAMAAALVLLGGTWPLAIVGGTVIYLGVYAAVDRVVDPDEFRFVLGLVRRRLPFADPARSGAPS